MKRLFMGLMAVLFFLGISSFAANNTQAKLRTVIYTKLGLSESKKFSTIENAVDILPSSHDWFISYIDNTDIATKSKMISYIAARDDGVTLMETFYIDNGMLINVEEQVINGARDSFVDNIADLKASGEYTQGSNSNDFQCFSKKGYNEKVCYNLSGEAFGTKVYHSIYREKLK